MSRRIKKKNSTSIDKTSQEESVSFDKNMYDHLRPENKAKIKATQATVPNASSLTKVYIIGIIGLIIVGMVITGAFTGDINPVINNDNNNKNPIDTNNDSEFILFKDRVINTHDDYNTHYHFFLSINLNGVPISIPTELGIDSTNRRMHLIHTHDTSSKVHVELPSSFTGTPTLGDFFAIWSDWSGENYNIGSTTLMGESGAVSLTSDGDLVDITNPGSYNILSNGVSDEIISLTLIS